MAYKSISTTSNNNFVYYETLKESRKHDIAQHLITYLAIFPLRGKSFFGRNTGKYGPEKTPYLDTFEAVSHCFVN